MDAERAGVNNVTLCTMLFIKIARGFVERRGHFGGTATL